MPFSSFQPPDPRLSGPQGSARYPPPPYPDHGHPLRLHHTHPDDEPAHAGPPPYRDDHRRYYDEYSGGGGHPGHRDPYPHDQHHYRDERPPYPRAHGGFHAPGERYRDPRDRSVEYSDRDRDYADRYREFPPYPDDREYRQGHGRDRDFDLADRDRPFVPARDSDRDFHPSQYNDPHMPAPHSHYPQHSGTQHPHFQAPHYAGPHAHAPHNYPNPVAPANGELTPEQAANALRARAEAAMAAKRANNAHAPHPAGGGGGGGSGPDHRKWNAKPKGPRPKNKGHGKRKRERAAAAAAAAAASTTEVPEGESSEGGTAEEGAEGDDPSATVAPEKKKKKQMYVPKLYACLRKGCMVIKDTWKPALQHMKSCGVVSPNLTESREKASTVLKGEGHTLPDRTPWEGVSEEQLIEDVKAYYATCETFFERKYVMDKAIRRKYGNFPFSNFGYGKFCDWSKKHNLPCK